MSTSGLNLYSGRGRASTSSEEGPLFERRRQYRSGHEAAGEDASGQPPGRRRYKFSARFGVGLLIFAGAVDIGDDVKLLIELNAGTESSARLAPSAEQAGQLHEAQVL